jgi:hypothetical protein
VFGNRVNQGGNVGEFVNEVIEDLERRLGCKLDVCQVLYHRVDVEVICDEKQIPEVIMKLIGIKDRKFEIDGVEYYVSGFLFAEGYDPYGERYFGIEIRSENVNFVFDEFESGFDKVDTMDELRRLGIE